MSKKRSLPSSIELVVFDFDGVMTDNAVYIFENGSEAVQCNRSDGLGISLLRERGIPIVVLSSERAEIVRSRCRKLGIECFYNVQDKITVLNQYVQQRGISLDNVIYVGNDVNDRDCLQAVGYAVIVADAHPDVIPVADYILSRKGGHGAVRELCDIIITHIKEQESVLCQSR